MRKVKDLDITNKDDLIEIIKYVTSKENVARKKHAIKTWECCEGKQLKYIRQRLSELYPKTWKYFRTGNLSIVKKIRNKKAKAYKQQPIRTLSTERQTKALEQIYDRNNFARSFKEIDKIFNEQKCVACWISYINPSDDEIEGRYVLKPLRPFDFDVMADEMTNEPIIFILPYYISNEQTKYEIYTDTVKTTILYNNTTDSIDDYVAVANELDILPFAFVTSEMSSAYPIPSPLADQSIEWNTELSDLKTAGATQGHGQLVIKYPSGSKPKEYRMGMHTAITLPQSNKPDAKPTEADYISASPDLAGQLEILKFDLVSLMEENDIVPKSSILGGVNDIKSGFDRLLKESDVQDIIEENQALYSEGLEQQIYLVIKAYEELMNNPIFADDSLQVAFQKPKVMISDKETLDNIEQREKLGLLLPWQKHQLINPNLSDKQAQELEAKIQEEKKKEIETMNQIFKQEANVNGNGSQQNN